MGKLIRRIIAVIVIAIAVAVAIDIYVVDSTKDLIVDYDVVKDQSKSEYIVKDPECIMVLGAAVYNDKTPTPMLQDRLDRAIELYNEGVAPKLLMTGDNGQVEYNEVETMKEYALSHGVPEEDIFLDHAGFSTYESIYRARDVFDVHSMVIVTQRYHEYRALYIAKAFGLDVMGVPSAGDDYRGQFARDVREFLARDKDFVKCIFKPEPTYLGEVISITGDGRKSWS